MKQAVPRIDTSHIKVLRKFIVDYLISYFEGSSLDIFILKIIKRRMEEVIYY